MCEEDAFAKRNSSAPHLSIQRDSAQFTEGAAFLSAKCQGHQRGTRLDDSQSELPCDVVAKIGRSDFGKGKTSARDYERSASEVPMAGCDPEAMVFPDFANGTAKKHIDASRIALPNEHVDDLLR